MLRFAPLKNSFMIFAIIGFFLSYFAVYRPGTNLNIQFMRDLGVAFLIVFITMIVAAVVSMTAEPVDYAPERKRK